MFIKAKFLLTLLVVILIEILFAPIINIVSGLFLKIYNTPVVNAIRDFSDLGKSVQFFIVFLEFIATLFLVKFSFSFQDNKFSTKALKFFVIILALVSFLASLFVLTAGGIGI